MSPLDPTIGFEPEALSPSRETLPHAQHHPSLLLSHTHNEGSIITLLLT
jgi:hypothetical protein